MSEQQEFDQLFASLKQVPTRDPSRARRTRAAFLTQVAELPAPRAVIRPKSPPTWYQWLSNFIQPPAPTMRFVNEGLESTESDETWDNVESNEELENTTDGETWDEVEGNEGLENTDDGETWDDNENWE
ncbi:MAG: hypothetical protein ACPG8W_24675, partial [Candidatus Promineifilaceae bacterium]